jgi:tetratricopeptide (TPR) repeat protein
VRKVPWLRFEVLLVAACLGVPPTLARQDEAAAVDAVTLRLRDAPLVDVLYSLFELTGQGYVVDADVVSRADVELTLVTPAEVGRALEQLGLSMSGEGRLRRVTAGTEPPALRLSGVGPPVSLTIRHAVEVREFLVLMTDVTGDEIVAPRGPLGRVLLFCTEVPTEDILSAALVSARLEFRREGNRILVWRRSEPDARLFAVSLSERHYGHVPYREGETVAARPAGTQGMRAQELKLTGLIGRGPTWRAIVSHGGQRSGYFLQPGTRLYDGNVESVGSDGVVVLLDGGERIEWRLRPAEPGINLLPEDASQTIDRAWVQRDAGAFDDAERILRAALEAAAAGDAEALRAALSDLHYAWAQALLVQHLALEAIRHFESAYEGDHLARPWQAGEDLNEIGFAWTDLREPERAVGPHRQALDLARTKSFRNEPRPPSCVRTHPRSSWIEPSALDGLANAERARGRLAEARGLYDRAIRLWREVDDPFGESAALTGLGLVYHGLGRYDRAVELHRQALAKPLDRHPWARAVVLNNLGSAQLALGRREEARASFVAALAAYRTLGDRGGEGAVLNNLGALAEARAAPAEACAAYEQALAASREADDRRGQAITLAHVERLAGQERPDDDALTRCRQALASAH